VRQLAPRRRWDLDLHLPLRVRRERVKKKKEEEEEQRQPGHSESLGAMNKPPLFMEERCLRTQTPFQVFYVSEA
jgi:hypothetical protein